MWQDMKMYWAWRSLEPCDYDPPTNKRLAYANVRYERWNPKPLNLQICCGVFDDDKYTPLHRDEILWHQNNGAVVTFPSNT